MSKIIAVIGATGIQGSGVVNAFLKDPTWKIRAITRNPSSDKAKALTAQGVEVVSAELDNIESLKKAFAGATAIYALTNFWEYIFTGGFNVASEKDYSQGLNLAHAAAATPTLEHYIWATLPSAKVQTGGKFLVPHVDKKAEVDEYIKNSLPALAKKTTFLWHGFYASNLLYFPNLKPTFFEAAGKHILVLPVPGKTILPITGDPSTNTGLFVRAIVSQPSLTQGKYTFIQTDVLTFDDMLKVWSKVTGKEALTVQVTEEAYEALWPVVGEEIGKQFAWHTQVSDWTSGVGEVVSAKELGIEGLVDLEGTLEALKGGWA